ncbi:bifunctional DNA primase/polymerase [Pseudonocardia alni]|uniref:DNA primase/polymerase bifunctional N-terminal domain-containing protein n=1 Tax=Pseudonocardia alni TaxID=33907 RepID=A0A852VW98_PSEA5|nr:bifunctional DNA primase/polymerase [Pseudonocardia antarctica]NYG00369.1 hypothetical protein [Pseudonocardia antarctica]
MPVQTSPTENRAAPARSGNPHGPRRGIYAAHAQRYRDAGWRYVLALPAGEKTPPMRGFTGAARVAPSGADIAEMAAWRPNGNLAIGAENDVEVDGRRWDVVFLDVDHYAKDGVMRRGGDTVAAIEAAVGATFPPTWSITSRGPGISGKFAGRIPAGTTLVTSLPGVELIQRHHRYAVAPPSRNPHDDGRPFLWRRGARPAAGNHGVEAEPGVIPRPSDIPEWPPELVAALTSDRPRIDPVEVSLSERREWWDSLAPAPICAVVRNRLVVALDVLQRGQRSRFDSTRNATLALLRAGERGHHGVREAIGELRRAYIRAVATSRAGGRTHGLHPDAARAEFGRMLRPEALGLVLADPTPEERAVCTCAEGLLRILLSDVHGPDWVHGQFGIGPVGPLLRDVLDPAVRDYFTGLDAEWSR